MLVWKATSSRSKKAYAMMDNQNMGYSVGFVNDQDEFLDNGVNFFNSYEEAFSFFKEHAFKLEVVEKWKIPYVLRIYNNVSEDTYGLVCQVPKHYAVGRIDKDDKFFERYLVSTNLRDAMLIFKFRASHAVRGIQMKFFQEKDSCLAGIRVVIYDDTELSGQWHVGMVDTWGRWFKGFKRFGTMTEALEYWKGYEGGLQMENKTCLERNYCSVCGRPVAKEHNDWRYCSYACHEQRRRQQSLESWSPYQKGER